MDSYEFNKIAGAVLGSLLFFMGLGILSSTIFARPHMHKPGYDLPAAAADTHGAPAADAPAVPLAELLAKANVERGAATVKSVCTTCHNVEKGAAPKPSGPNLPGVVGRVMGSTEFAYSDDLKNKKQPWTYESLDAFLNNPKSMGSGVKMTYSEKNPQKRAEIIAYLRSITDNAPPLPTP